MVRARDWLGLVPGGEHPNALAAKRTAMYAAFPGGLDTAAAGFAAGYAAVMATALPRLRLGGEAISVAGELSLGTRAYSGGEANLLLSVPVTVGGRRLPVVLESGGLAGGLWLWDAEAKEELYPVPA